MAILTCFGCGREYTHAEFQAMTLEGRVGQPGLSPEKSEVDYYERRQCPHCPNQVVAQVDVGPTAGELLAKIEKLPGLERRIIERQLDRLLLGLGEYGPWDFAEKSHTKETLEELLDSAQYLAAEILNWEDQCQGKKQS